MQLRHISTLNVRLHAVQLIHSSSVGQQNESPVRACMLGEQSVPVPLSPPQLPHTLYRGQNGERCWECFRKLYRGCKYLHLCQSCTRHSTQSMVYWVVVPCRPADRHRCSGKCPALIFGRRNTYKLPQLSVGRESVTVVIATVSS